MLDIIRVPIGYVIDLCYRLVPNYAVALLFFALVMKLILFPLGIKQQKNMVHQARLRPKEMAIRKRYAGRTDKVTQQKMQQEILKLYQDEKFNPASGCLPMILQLIIVFALFSVVNSPLRYVSHISKDNVNNIAIEMAELYKDGELTTEGLPSRTVNALDSMKKDLEDKGETKNRFVYDIDMVNVLRVNGVEKFHGEKMLGSNFTDRDLPNFHLVGEKFDLSQVPSLSHFDWLWVLPLLTFIFTLGSMKLSRKFMYQPPQTEGAPDAALSMKMMDYVTPLISTVFAFQVPAVVAVYWIYQNIFSTLQQFILKLIYPYPTFTEEEYKAVEREMNKGIRQPKKNTKKKSGAAHRIDLDGTEEQEQSAPGKPSSLLPPAALKDESDKPNETNDGAEETETENGDSGESEPKD